MYKAAIFALSLMVYQFTGSAGYHRFPILSNSDFTASCVFIAETVGSEKMRESRLCKGA